MLVYNYPGSLAGHGTKSSLTTRPWHWWCYYPAVIPAGGTRPSGHFDGVAKETDVTDIHHRIPRTGFSGECRFSAIVGCRPAITCGVQPQSLIRWKVHLHLFEWVIDGVCRSEHTDWLIDSFYWLEYTEWVIDGFCRSEFIATYASPITRTATFDWLIDSFYRLEYNYWVIDNFIG